VSGEGRARSRELGLAPGDLPTGPVNAITDVAGVRVGHTTLIEGAGIRTGVTAIVHDLLIRRGTLPAGLAIFNGFGKMVGTTQITELGSIETPVLLTGTLSVYRVADALLSYLHDQPAYAATATLNPVVAETNDGYLSDIWARPVTAAHVRAAIEGAAGGPVAEGCVGAGTGTSALGFKAGIGTSSRLVRLGAGAQATVGVLVQANFGGVLTIAGAEVLPPSSPPLAEQPGGSCVIVLATDAALSPRELERLAGRAFAGMARTGSDFSGHSGDYALAFTTASGAGDAAAARSVPAKDLDRLFVAAAEASEEAILNSLLAAESMTGFRGHARQAVPLDLVRGLLSGRPGTPTGS
jgi:D-aminopeptidase